MAVVRVELVVGSLVVEVVVCLSIPAPFAETLRPRDKRVRDDTKQTAINNVFVFMVAGLMFCSFLPTLCQHKLPKTGIKLSARDYQNTIIMAKYSKKAQDKVEKTMHERKAGTLKSGSGKKVTSRKQAIAIGLSEAREAGAKVPARKAASKKSAAKKTTKKATAKKASKKSTAKTTTKKATAKKATAKKTAKKTGTKKSPAKKSAAKKS